MRDKKRRLRGYMKEKNGKPLSGVHKQNLRGRVLTVLAEMGRGERIANLRDSLG